jgi:hypothetical protein
VWVSNAGKKVRPDRAGSSSARGLRVRAIRVNGFCGAAVVSLASAMDATPMFDQAAKHIVLNQNANAKKCRRLYTCQYAIPSKGREKLLSVAASRCPPRRSVRLSLIIFQFQLAKI